MEVEVEPGDVGDRGVEDCIEATESYVREGEHIERESTICHLEDGGISIGQGVQGMHESIFMSAELFDTILNWYREDDSCPEDHLDWKDKSANYCPYCGVSLKRECIECGSRHDLHRL